MNVHLLLANVIFPAPSLPYVTSLFLPAAGLLALGAECGVFAAFMKGTRPAVLFGLVISANVFSWLAGVLIGGQLPWEWLPTGLLDDGSPTGQFHRGPHFWTIARWSFVVACVASFVLELAFVGLVTLLFRIRMERPAACVGLANVASYGVLGLMATAL